MFSILVTELLLVVVEVLLEILVLLLLVILLGLLGLLLSVLLLNEGREYKVTYTITIIYTR